MNKKNSKNKDFVKNASNFDKILEKKKIFKGK